MASLFKKEGSPYYWMRFSHKGIRYQESTKKTRSDGAQAVMEARIAEVKGSGGFNDLFDRFLASIDKQPATKQSDIRKDFANRLLAGDDSKVLISQAFALYTAKPKRKSQSAIINKRYGSVWKKFEDWLKGNCPAVKYLHEVTPAMVEGFMTYRWGQNIGERTYNGNLLLIGHVFKVLALDGGIAVNPTKDIEKQDIQSISRKNLTPKQLEAIVKKAEGDIKTLILIGLYTGMRLGDASTLKWEAVNLAVGIITYEPRKTKKKVKKTKVEIPIHSVLTAVLTTLKAQGMDKSGYVLPRLAEQYNRHSHYVSQQVQAVFIEAGLKTNTSRDDGRGRRLSNVYGFHSLRHSFVSLCHANGVPQIAVMDLVGHSNSAVHEIYMHGNKELNRMAIASIPDITGGMK